MKNYQNLIAFVLDFFSVIFLLFQFSDNYAIIIGIYE